MFAPLITDPAAGAEAVPEGAIPVVVAAGVVPVAGAVGLVLEHPAIATAITTSMIAMILICETFILSPPYLMTMPDKRLPGYRNPDAGIKMVIYVQFY
jgi:hypothetical protein